VLKKWRSVTDEPHMWDGYESHSHLAVTVENHADDRVSGDPFLMIDAMPVAMFVVDDSAQIVFANQRLASLIGRPVDDMVGRSAFEFIDSRDADDALGLLSERRSDDASVRGPSRIRYLDSNGVGHHTQFWANAAPADLGFAGFVITLTPESVHDVLAEAVTSLASAEPLDRSLFAVAMAGRAAPLDGVGTILIVEPCAPTDADRFRVVGDWPIAESLLNAYGTPWRRCLVRGEEQDIFDCSLAAVDARIGAEMAMAGLPAAWVRPVHDPSGEVAAVFVVWRRSRAEVTLNQERHLDGAIYVIRLALERSQHRRALENAAHRDALTGVGNRASLSGRIDSESGVPSVLFIDLDHFNAVNETFGHDVGDQVIAQVGRRLIDSVRASDDVYRSGGDEFVVVCNSPVSDPRELIVLGERIVETISAPFDCRDHRVRIGATVGIGSGTICGAERDLHDTIQAADRAMYIAKERGRGSVHHADVPD
jgi:diguanylate cyclase (GGDEF)-like protein/PAS domain S-box-containing protein